MFEVFIEGINLDYRNFDERYEKSFYEAIEKLKPQFLSGNNDPKKYLKHATCSAVSYF